MKAVNGLFDEVRSGKIENARTLGVDIGSRAAKGVLLFDGKVYSAVIPSGVSSEETANLLIGELMEKAGVSAEDIKYMVGTGYGRIAVNPGNIPYREVTEIACHAMGGHFINPSARTILDIGGQDSKAIKVDPEDGKVIEFVMNDKCAAGTGRFLEKVAQILELGLSEFGEAAVTSDDPAEISSQCVVFAESEVISLKARGVDKADIAAGVHYATARRVYNLLKRVGLEETVIFTGGVSNNLGMRDALEKVIGYKLGHTVLDPMLAGALGAAIYAHDFTEGE